MSFSVGIIGLPNVGKSTLFKALTQQEVDISNYPFCTIDPNVGIVQVPDERLEKISEIIKPEKTTPTVIEFVDIAGLVKGAHKGEGLGNQFLAHIREVNAVIHVVRGFSDENIKHVEEKIDPLRDIEIVNTELELKDLESKEKENLLSKKPVIYALNIREKTDIDNLLKSLPKNTIPLDLKLELEISELSPDELKELKLKSRMDVLIKTCYKILNLITFYTIKGGEETRAWTAKEGTLAPQCGGVVHSDFEEKFIKADIINYKDLIECGSWNEARTKGLVRTEGKNYQVKDGDVIEFKI